MGIQRTSAALIGAAVLSGATGALATPPPAATGFQADFGFGVAFPTGTATGAPGDGQARRYAWELVPINIGLGAKVTQSAYIGVYLGLGIGSEGSDRRVSTACASGDDGVFKNDVACTTTTWFFGVKGRYSFLPGEGVDPWISYGVGLESTSFYFTDRLAYKGAANASGTVSLAGASSTSSSSSSASRTEQVTMTGIEYGRIGAGLDFRPGRAVGLGPFIEASYGTYTHSSTERNGTTTYSGSVPSTTLHGWIMAGLRLVVFP